MRVIMTSDRDWYGPDLAEEVVDRLVLKHGSALVSVHGAGIGFDHSFTEGRAELGVEDAAHPARSEEPRILPIEPAWTGREK
jgi:hypothetical protein